MTIIYFGALSRYSFNSTRTGSDIHVEGEKIQLIDSEWHKTIGSYKFINNEDGTYSSFEIKDNGKEYPLKINKRFNKADLESEINSGYLVPAS